MGDAMWACLAVVLMGCAVTGADLPDEPPDSTPQTVDTADTAPPEDSDTDTEPPEPLDPVTELFEYSAPVADVLFVIDHSFSMTDDVEVLVGALEGVVETWESRGILYQAGATDIDDSATQGVLTSVNGHRWADPSHPTPGTLLRQLVNSVGDPSSTEAGRMAAYTALELTDPGEPNEGFLREASEIVIVVFTDEADQSPVDLPPDDFVDYVLALRPDPALVGFHSIVATADYTAMSAALGGVSWSVTNSPYGPVLDAITDTIELKNVFTLSVPAVPDSITAHVLEPDGEHVALGPTEVVYDEEARTVDLGDYGPRDGALVEVAYVPAP